MPAAAWEEWDVAGPATHALVIGVSQYDHLPEKPGDPSPTDPARTTYGLGQAKTPATGALNFAKWMRDVHNMPDAPKASIRLLLSPSQFELERVEGMDDLGPDVLPATRANVRAALDAWQAACATDDGNVAILYAGGHGIELTKDEGGIVLLQDFGESPGSPLDNSLDVARVRNGMAGHPMAQRQFYFVDACRVPPKEVGAIDTQGAGLVLQSPSKGAPECSPIYFSAAPTTEAFGQELAGTVFAQALIDCLERLGVDARDDEGRWYCSTTGLIRGLEERVREIADELGVEQTTVPGGTPAPRAMHVLTEPPEVLLEISVWPDAAAPRCTASLREPGRAPLLDDGRFDPVLRCQVPAASYRLDVRVDPAEPPYRSVDGWPAPALPPRPYPVRVELEPGE
jgi:hypothetical protein